ncbi:MAG TPA: tRNA uridine-5-carboxymethylaminomethyl(34) synthesis GTPase MnmE [Candidatus Binataceae bacterium]|nr:tRNA uridine-5-carboxymethylaminomethyl(34) synthesis GTPase MnmE [Candidatus Binataceae bacterium]
MYVGDTIVASATAPGTGAVAIVRLSGPRTMEILQAIFTPASPGAIEPRKLHLGDVIDPVTGAQIDRAMAVKMPAPASLTGEDVAEIQCHGGPYLVRRIVAIAVAAGARMAEPGEFSRRAFLNGRIDLAEAEAIADLIEARGESALKQALAQLSGALSERVGRLREQVIAIAAHLEADIDFSDEDIRLPSRRETASAIERLLADVTLLHSSFARGRLMREGVRAAIAGPPNAGKSSVLNLLIGADRAIVTPIAGTTRDVIEESTAIGPHTMVLNDTAGIRESNDEVERIGIERTRRAAAQADLLIAVFDGSRALEAADDETIRILEGRPGIAILNKRDLLPVTTACHLRGRGIAMPIIALSAIDPADAEPLRAELERAIEAMTGAPPADEATISRERHRAALERAASALKHARESALALMPPEIVAVDIASASDALGQITGAVSGEDILDAIFRDFCIGK